MLDRDCPDLIRNRLGLSELKWLRARLPRRSPIVFGMFFAHVFSAPKARQYFSLGQRPRWFHE